MAIARSNYILLRHPKRRDVERTEDGRVVVHVDLMREAFRAAFPDLKREEDSSLYQERFTFASGSAKVTLTNNRVGEQHYLAIEVSARTKRRAIEVLEESERKLFQGAIKGSYIDIVSYDGVSEYYSNEMYSLLNALERKLRQLLLNVYTLKFDESFIEQLPDAIRKGAKRQTSKLRLTPFDIRRYQKALNLDKEELEEVRRAKHIFEGLTLGDVKTLLFSKRVIEQEREEVCTITESVDDLGTLSDAELRGMFAKLDEKSDWERYFEQKVPFADIRNAIIRVEGARNAVAHCRPFHKKEYEQAKKLTEEIASAIDEAIRITEEEDFAAKNSDALRTAVRMIKELFESIAESSRVYLENAQKIATRLISNLAGTTGADSKDANHGEADEEDTDQAE